jgi:4-diphosphocytidyl-2-C-methyl-D-erythritol kinase
MFSERAPAKINLYLHVTGKRADGYHELNSLVVFAKDAQACDRVELEAADAQRLTIKGPESGALKNEPANKNLICKALSHLGSQLGRAPHFEIVLHKNLPVASGIGGGSSDAAAALRAAAKCWNLNPDHPALTKAALATGADVPACLLAENCYMSGKGDVMEKLNPLPRFYLLLANPHIPLPTPSVFAARQGPFSAKGQIDPMPATPQEFARILAARTNDLEAPAIELCAAIADVLTALKNEQGCLLARMSGSGATCFGVFANFEEASTARQHIKSQVREWWVAVTEI